MRWSERQRAMLREMGIRLWMPEREDAPASDARQPTPPAASSSPARPVAGPDAASARRWPGLAPADWLVVAEPLEGAEPQQEQLLESMLRAIGVGLVAPDRERRAAFCPLAGENGAASEAVDLRRAIATVAPRCILAFGAAAAAALLQADAPLGALRGRVHAHSGSPVVVTFSLVYLLRHPAEKAKAWADLCLAVGALAPRAPADAVSA
jgi:uracil-DNA glycosylase